MAGKRSSTGSPHLVDRHVGERLRTRRAALGMTLEDLAGALGVSCQQVQKYESATNRMSASRLWEAAAVLAVPVPYFFEELSVLPARSPGEEETERLLRAYARIPDGHLRQLLFDFIAALASTDDAPKREQSPP